MNILTKPLHNHIMNLAAKPTYETLFSPKSPEFLAGVGMMLGGGLYAYHQKRNRQDVGIAPYVMGAGQALTFAPLLTKPLANRYARNFFTSKGFEDEMRAQGALLIGGYSQLPNGFKHAHKSWLNEYETTVNKRLTDDGTGRLLYTVGNYKTPLIGQPTFSAFENK